MTAVALTGRSFLRLSAPRRRALRDGRGFGLVELLIALMVLNVGIFATVAAFNAGSLALRRASLTSTAGALADKEMEGFRSLTYEQIRSLPASSPPLTELGPDGRTYTLEKSVSPEGSQSGGSGSYYGGRPVTTVTVVVHQGGDTTGRVLVRAVSTFEQCTQDRTADACGKDPTA